MSDMTFDTSIGLVPPDPSAVDLSKYLGALADGTATGEVAADIKATTTAKDTVTMAKDTATAALAVKAVTSSIPILEVPDVSTSKHINEYFTMAAGTIARLALMEVAKEQSKLRLSSVQTQVTQLEAIRQAVHSKVEAIVELASLRAQEHINNAIAAGVSAGAGLVSSGVIFGKTLNSNQASTSKWTQIISGLRDGVSNFTKMGTEITTANLQTQQGTMESQSFVADQMIALANQMMDSAKQQADAYLQNISSLIQQTDQTSHAQKSQGV